MIVAAILGAIVVGPFIYYIMPFEPVDHPTVIATGRLACGDVVLTQTFTATPDPYVVRFYFRASGAKLWSEYYVDDESVFWRGGVRVDQDREGCRLIFYGADQARFSCRDQLLAQRGRLLPAKAF